MSFNEGTFIGNLMLKTLIGSRAFMGITLGIIIDMQLFVSIYDINMKYTINILC